MKTQIFVFGSNLAGVHGAGAAKYALEKCGAVMRKGVGRHGTSYAIPTKDDFIKTMPLHEIKPYVRRFLDYAREHDDLDFFVTRIGCGLAGYTDADVAPMFKGAPANCILPKGWTALAEGIREHADSYPY